MDATIERWFTPTFREERTDVIDLIRRWVLANDPPVYAQCREVLARGVTELIRPDPPIACPMFVATSENDSGSTPEMTRRIAGETTDAVTMIVPGLQHMGLVERPSEFVGPLMRFLDQTLAPGPSASH